MICIRRFFFLIIRETCILIQIQFALLSLNNLRPLYNSLRTNDETHNTNVHYIYGEEEAHIIGIKSIVVERAAE